VQLMVCRISSACTDTVQQFGRFLCEFPCKLGGAVQSGFCRWWPLLTACCSAAACHASATAGTSWCSREFNTRAKYCFREFREFKTPAVVTCVGGSENMSAKFSRFHTQI
jgi:hypothetical protein